MIESNMHEAGVNLSEPEGADPVGQPCFRCDHKIEAGELVDVFELESDIYFQHKSCPPRCPQCDGPALNEITYCISCYQKNLEENTISFDKSYPTGGELISSELLVKNRR